MMGANNGARMRQPGRFNSNNLNVKNSPNAAGNMQAFAKKTQNRMNKFSGNSAKQGKIQQNFLRKSKAAGW